MLVRCPFYPKFCSVERHPALGHKWRDGVTVEAVDSVTHNPPAEPSVTHRAVGPAARQKRYRERLGEEYRKRNRERMAKRRAT